jgi:putative transposase
VKKFIVSIYHTLHKSIVLILDRWSVHKAAAKRLIAKYGDKIKIEYLPAYAPQLNPVELVWCNVKSGTLANYIADDINELEKSATSALAAQKKKSKLLKSFFQHAGLAL